MRVAILSSLMLSALFAVTGCSVSSQNTRHSSAPGTYVADTSNDPSWTPPGEMNFSINESAPVRASNAARHHVQAAPAPNHREIKTHQLRAAKAIY